MLLIQAIPDELNLELAPLGERVAGALRGGDWRALLDVEGEIYKRLLDAQPPGHRYHKGGPLMSMGAALINAGLGGQAFPYLVMAFIEDVLSRGEESPLRLDELSRPAAMTLVYSFVIPGRALVDLSTRLRARQAEGKLWQNPGDAWNDEPLQLTPAPEAQAAAAAGVVAAANERIRLPRWRSPGLFGTPFDDRVFIGGSYRPELLAVIGKIRDVVRDHGLDAVVVAEFKHREPTPQVNYADSLLLLRACRAAIFDVSESRGQLHELQEAHHVGIKNVLVVHPRAERISDMTIGAASELGGDPVHYDNIDDLERIVGEWLVTALGAIAPGANGVA